MVNGTSRIRASVWARRALPEPVGRGHHKMTMIAVSPDGTRAYVNNVGSGTTSVVDTKSNLVVATIAVGSGPYGVAISPDGSHAYIANNSGTVSVIDTSSNSVVSTINVGGEAVGI